MNNFSSTTCWRDRHVGDLGNFQADLKGKIVEKFEDNVVSLQGDNNVIGRAVVVSSLFKLLCLTINETMLR